MMRITRVHLAGRSTDNSEIISNIIDIVNKDTRQLRVKASNKVLWQGAANGLNSLVNTIRKTLSPGMEIVVQALTNSNKWSTKYSAIVQ